MSKNFEYVRPMKIDIMYLISANIVILLINILKEGLGKIRIICLIKIYCFSVCKQSH